MKRLMGIALFCCLWWLPGLSIAQGVEGRMFIGVYDPSNAFDDVLLDVELGFFEWTDAEGITQFLAEASRLGRIPIVSLEPHTTATDNVLFDTAQGRNDSILAQLSLVLSTHQGPIWLRWAQEPELTGLYPWGQGWPDRYIAAFRYVSNYLLASVVQPERLKFMFAPAGNFAGIYYFPGYEYVDAISLTLLSDSVWDTQWLGNRETRSFHELLQEKYWHYAQFNLPMYLGEFGVSRTAEDERQAWLDEALAELHTGNWPYLVGLVYFNARNAENQWTQHLPEWSISPENFWTTADMPALTLITASLFQ